MILYDLSQMYSVLRMYGENARVNYNGLHVALLKDAPGYAGAWTSYSPSNGGQTKFLDGLVEMGINVEARALHDLPTVEDWGEVRFDADIAFCMAKAKSKETVAVVSGSPWLTSVLSYRTFSGLSTILVWPLRYLNPAWRTLPGLVLMDLEPFIFGTGTSSAPGQNIRKLMVL